MKKLPYGISDFNTLIEKNYVFVDKTNYIEKLENYPAPYVFFFRPRRFGKSLFTSMLSYYYDINESNNVEKLFKDTYIGNNPTPERSSYYILSFNFSGLNTDTKDSLEESFTTTVKQSIRNFILKYNLSVTYEEDTYVAGILNTFLSDVTYKIDKPIYVIIDEYDHFANELLSFKTELFKDLVSKTGFIRKFYETLKIGTSTIIGRIFATGVSPITLDSMTSGFNIAKNLTTNVNFNEMIGFTENEVRELIKLTVNDSYLNDLDNLISILKFNYNGYLFSELATTRLFNSDMILYYLQELLDTGFAPKNLIDPNIASDYSKISNLFYLTTKDSSDKIITKILRDEELIGGITTQFSLEKDFNTEDFLSLLFYLGFLTIDKEDFMDIIYKVPNQSIKEIYFDYFAKYLEKESNYEIETNAIKSSIKSLATKGDLNPFIKIIELTLNKLSNRDFISWDEKYIKIIMIAYLNLTKTYLIKSEYEVENGYIDIALLSNHLVEPTYYGIIELKYITRKEYDKYGDKIVDQRKSEAITQIENYKTSKELLTYKNLKKWVLVFVKDKCVVNLEIN